MSSETSSSSPGNTDPHLRLLHKAAEMRKTFLREGRRSHFWRAALVGILAGAVAVLFQLALVGAESLRQGLMHVVQQFGHLRLLTSILFCSALAGAAGYLTLKYCPEASGSGIPHVKAVLLNVRQLRWIHVTFTKFIGGFLSIAAGLSLGREVQPCTSAHAWEKPSRINSRFRFARTAR